MGVTSSMFPIFNPALVGRLFTTIAFPQLMSATWKEPFADVITSATPLGVFQTTGEMTPYMDLLMGMHAGSMGEVFSLGIIAGGIFLMLSKVSNWRIPVSFLGTVFVFSFIGNISVENFFLIIIFINKEVIMLNLTPPDT